MVAQVAACVRITTQHIDLPPCNHPAVLCCGVPCCAVQVFEVPDGHRMVVTSSGAAGGLSVQLLPLEGDKPTWQWTYSMEPGGAVQLEFVRHTALDLWSSPVLAAARLRQQHEEDVLDFVI